jgi:PAS domain S-box-containing protein
MVFLLQGGIFVALTALWFGWVLDRAFARIRAGMLKTQAETTERQRADEKLRESEARYRALFNEAVDGILLLAPDAQTFQVNKAFARMHGYGSPQEMESLRFGALETAVSAPLSAERVRRLYAGENLTFEVEHFRKDGSIFPLSVTASRVELGGAWHLLGFHRDLSQQKRTEEQLHLSEQRYHTLVDQLPLALVLTDVSGRVVAANQAAAELRGLDRWEDLIGRELPDFVAPDERARLQAAVEAALTEGRMQPLESTIPREDGASVTVLLTGVILKDAQGKPSGLLALAENISQRKLAESAIRRQSELQDQLGKVAATVPGVICSFKLRPDGSSCMPFATPAIEDVYGVRPEDVREDFSAILDWMNPDDRAVHRQSVAESARTLQPWHQTFRIRHPRKGEVWLEGSSVPRREPDGSVLWHGFVQDVTDRKDAETALRESERQLATLMANLPGMAYRIKNGPDWPALFVSDGCTELTGYESARVLNNDPAFGNLIVSADRQAVWEKVQQALAAREPFELTYRIQAADGLVKWVWERGRGVFAPDGTLLFLEGFITDVTERKTRDAELARARDFYLQLLESTPALVWRAGTDGKCDWFNASWLKFTGRTMAQELGDGWVAGIHPDDRAGCFKGYLDSFGRRESFAMEYRLRHHTGEYRWIADHGVPFQDLEGKFGGYIGYCFDITERKRAAQELAERKELFSIVVAQAADAILIYDAITGRFVDFNAVAHEGLGYTREEFANLKVQDFEAEQSPEAVKETMNDVLRLGRISFESTHRHRDGSPRSVRINIRKLDIRDREYLVAVWTDVTESKRAEARARRDAQRTEFLLEFHQRAPQMTDKELYDHVLERAVQLTGSAIGFFHQISEDEKNILLTTWNTAALKDCEVSTSSHYPLQEAGNWVDCVREQRSIIYNDYANSPNQRGLPEGHPPLQRFMSIPVIRDGKVRIIFGVGNKPADYDFDDLEQLQVVANELHKLMGHRAIENQLRQLSSAVEQSPASVVITNTEGGIEYVNPRFTAVSGYSLAEVRGKNPWLLKAGEPNSDQFHQLWQTVLAGHAWRGELHNRKKSGESHWEIASVSPITDSSGRVTHFVAVNEDVTDRKRLESQLRQSQKLEAVGQLAGGVAHDFNNILAALMMHLGLLQMNPGLTDHVREMLKDMDAGVRRAAALTRQLLMFSRRSVLTIKPQDLNDLIANLLKMLTRLIGENIELDFEGSSTLPSIEADAGMLEQVLMNLVVNARDAMPKGGRINITTTAVDLNATDVAMNPERRQGHFVRLTVSDTGTGMDDATIKRIFEPFFTTKEAGKGTGLGLATVHGIVAQHRGWVEVESALGRGTTFNVFLPTAARAATRTPEPLADGPLQRGQETILLVEDEDIVRLTVAKTLRTLGYQVHEAANGQEAMKLWRTHGPKVDLLLTDMVMPEGITGLELTKRLQALKPRLKAIISSGYSTEIAQSGPPTKAGLFYLPKPYETPALARMLRSCLDSEAPAD